MIDLNAKTEAAPAKASTEKASRYWRSIDQLENTPEFEEFLHREFPQAASELPEGVSRRRWLQLMGASFALATAQGCRWQTEKFAPFSERPEGYVPGTTNHYATSFNWAGAPRHLLVTCYDGRPVKVEGNPEHPGSRGGTDSFSQAATLALYDPDRQANLIQREQGESFSKEWSDFDTYLSDRVTALGEGDSPGAGLGILMAPSPSLALNAELSKLFEAMPGARLYHYEPLSRDNELAAAEQAFGERVRTHYRLADADVIAAFDADFLVDRPDSITLARDYADRREPDTAKNEAGMNRLYSVESQFSVTGAAADHRLAVRSSEMAGLLAELRDLVKAGGPSSDEAAAEADTHDADTHEGDHAEGHAEEHAAGPSREEFIAALAEDLIAAKGKSVVIVGSQQSVESHTLAHEINSLLENLGTTVVATAEPEAAGEANTIADLVGDIAALKIDTLVLLGGNPIYDAPADLSLAEELQKVEHTIHLSCYDDETSKACHWSLPSTHPLESWGDAAAWDGTTSVAQPTIEPLLGGRSALELIAKLAGSTAKPQELVREAVEAVAGSLDSDGWKKLLHDGFLADSAAEPVDVSFSGSDASEPSEAAEAEEAKGDSFELVFLPSSSTYDGSLANNGWLQETPSFITKLTWDNAALMGKATADKIGAGQGDMIRISAGDRKIELPVFIVPGTAEGSIGVALGYGRTAAGRVGGSLDENGNATAGPYAAGLAATWFPAPAKPVGFDVYPLRASDAMNYVVGVECKTTGRTYQLATTQDHFAIDELGMKEISDRSGELVREATLETYGEHPDFAKHVEHHLDTDPLWNQLSHDDGRAWGMAIDLNKCIGCNACSVACQAENNVPVVGKDQVARGREMHWIRIDRYFHGTVEAPQVAYQPVACQHCETAPCEQVCPVAATVHSAEGLNDMVYNRCIGTRYCANNCPLKVRRFNFFAYNDQVTKANNELQQLVINPEVTVRSRGVMEKCTYCTQRISKARIEAKNEGRPIREEELQSACQQACPTRAIEFGDLNQKDSRVAKAHADDRSYSILEGLNLKQRTVYLARIRNPHPKLEKYIDMYAAGHGGGHGEHHGEGTHDDHHKDGDHEGDHDSNIGVEPPVGEYQASQDA